MVAHHNVGSDVAKFSEPNMFEFFLKKNKVLFLADTLRSAHSNLMPEQNDHQNIIQKTADTMYKPCAESLEPL